MARVVDLRGAFVGRGYPGARAGAVAVEVTRDGLVRDNVGAATVVVEGGRGHVAAERAPGVPLVRGAIGPISAVLVGALRLTAARRAGLVEVDGDIDAADALLALPVPYPLVTF
jgi:hypothetical protein